MTRVAPSDRSPVELDPRRLFTPKQRALVFLICGGRCAKCGVRLDGAWQCDHVLAHNLGGRTEVGNGEALCLPCHAAKTKPDTTIAAKTKRQAKLLQPKEPSKRGFRRWRRFDGTIVERCRREG